MASWEPGSRPPSAIPSSATTSSSSDPNAPSRSSRTPFTKPNGVPDSRAGQFDHLALNLPDEDALHDLRRRLQSADCEVTDIVDHGGVRSVYFTDPDGIALEASWWVLDPTGLAADYGDDRFFADPNPVPALHELRANGGLTSVPSTRLSQ